jgi:hypothetical protein
MTAKVQIIFQTMFFIKRNDKEILQYESDFDRAIRELTENNTTNEQLK